MKKIFVVLAVLVGGLGVVSLFNHARADLAVSAIYPDYKLCRSGYKLLGEKEQFLKNIASFNESEEKYRNTIETINRVEDSCARYYKYLGEWSDLKIKPSDDLVWALVSRYEPEKIK
ncbi:MAG: hypothetical protein ACK5X3_20145 [Pseudomonadota bacterium]|jgi:hypothetical protein